MKAGSATGTTWLPNPRGCRRELVARSLCIPAIPRSVWCARLLFYDFSPFFSFLFLLLLFCFCFPFCFVPFKNWYSYFVSLLFLFWLPRLKQTREKKKEIKPKQKAEEEGEGERGFGPSWIDWGNYEWHWTNDVSLERADSRLIAIVNSIVNCRLLIVKQAPVKFTKSKVAACWERRSTRADRRSGRTRAPTAPVRTPRASAGVTCARRRLRAWPTLADKLWPTPRRAARNAGRSVRTWRLSRRPPSPSPTPTPTPWAYWQCRRRWPSCRRRCPPRALSLAPTEASSTRQVAPTCLLPQLQPDSNRIGPQPDPFQLGFHFETASIPVVNSD